MNPAKPALPRQTLPNPVPFPTLAELDLEHSRLLRQLSEEEADQPSEATIHAVKHLAFRAAATGRRLYSAAERADAQAILTFWASVLQSARHSPGKTILDHFDPKELIQDGAVKDPYKGLLAFQPEDADIFFGRKDFVADMLRVLDTERVLAVTGLSGSGKSSVVRAGLLPALRQGALDGSSQWVVFGPFVPGNEPLESLVEALRPRTADPEVWRREKVAALRQSRQDLSTVLDWRDTPSVLIVDQLEEAFTLSTPSAEQKIFFEILADIIRMDRSSHRVILAMRSEFEPRLLDSPLCPLLENAILRVAPLQLSELQNVIVRPAERFGVAFDPEVVRNLLKNVGSEAAGLPLLQFALMKLWQARRNNLITMAEYKLLGGSPQQILVRSANQAFSSLDSDAERKWCREIFLSLLKPGDVDVTSRRRFRAELGFIGPPENVDPLLGRLEQAGLIRRTESSQPEKTAIEVTHESLTRNWPQLADWVRASLPELRRKQLLEETARQWVASPLSVTLYASEQLKEAKTFTGLTPIENSFLAASQKAETQHNEQARKLKEAEHTRQLWGRGLVAATITALLAAMAFFHATGVASVSSEMALLSQSILDENTPAAFLLADYANTRLSFWNWRLPRPHIDAMQALQGIIEDSRESATYDFSDESPNVDGAAFSHEPGSGWIAAAGGQQLLVWETAKGPAELPWLAPLTGEKSIPKDVAFGPGGVLAVADGKVLRVWSVKTLKQQCESEPADSNLTRVAFSNDGMTVAAGTHGGVLLLNTTQCKPLAPLVWGLPERKKENAEVTDVAFNSDGSRLAVAGRDHTTRVFDLVTKKQIGGALIKHIDSVRAVAFGKILPSPIQKETRELLASAGEDGVVLVWDRVLTAPDYTFKLAIPQPNTVAGLAFDRSGERLVGSNFDGYATVWDMRWGKELMRVGSPAYRMTSVDFDANGSRIVTAGWDGKVHVWKAGTDHADVIGSLDVSEDGKTLVTGGWDGKVKIWSIDGHEKKDDPSEFYNGTEVKSVAIFGKKVLAVGVTRDIVQWDSVGKMPLVVIPKAHLDAISSVAFSRDGTLAVTGSWDHTAKIWRTRDWAKMQELNGHSDRIEAVAFTSDMREVITGARDGTVRIWDVATGKQKLSLSAELPTSKFDNKVFSVAVNQKFLCAGTFGGAITCWPHEKEKYDETNRKIHHVHLAGVRSLRFDRDGSLISASADKTTRMWNVADWRELRRIQDQGPVYAAAMLVPNKYLVSAGGDKNVHIYRLDRKELLDAAQSRKTTKFTDAECFNYLGRGCPAAQ